MALEHAPERRVEAPRAVALGRADELVLEAEAVQERLQTRGSCCGRNSLPYRKDRGSRSAACGGARRPSRVAGCCRARRAARPCRRRRRRASWAGPRAARRPGAPGRCGRPRRRCRCAAGPRGRSRSRTATKPFAGGSLLDALDQLHGLDHRPRLARPQQLEILRHGAALAPASRPGNRRARRSGAATSARWRSRRWGSGRGGRRPRRGAVGSGSSPGRMPSSAAKIPRVTNRLS